MAEEIFKGLGHIFPFLIFIAILILVLFSSRRRLRKFKEKLDAIAMSMGGKVVSSTAEDYVRLTGSGSEQRIQLILAGKNTPDYLVLKQLCELDFDLHITRENTVTKFAGKHGLHMEIQIGDPVFDDKYLVMTKSREKAVSFLMSSERRQIIDDFFNAGFDDMTLTHKEVAFQKPDYSDKDLDPDLLHPQLEQVRKFISG